MRSVDLSDLSLIFNRLMLMGHLNGLTLMISAKEKFVDYSPLE